MLDQDRMRRLVAAWERWDRQPMAKHAAHLLEDECQAVAPLIGTTGTQLRWAVVQRRQAGMTAAEAIEEVVGA